MYHSKKRRWALLVCLCWGVAAGAEPVLPNKTLAADEIKQTRQLARHLLIARAKEKTRLQTRNQPLRQALHSAKQAMKGLEKALLQSATLQMPIATRQATLGPLRRSPITELTFDEHEAKSVSAADAGTDDGSDDDSSDHDGSIARYAAAPRMTPAKTPATPTAATQAKQQLDKAIDVLADARLKLADSSDPARQSGRYQLHVERPSTAPLTRIHTDAQQTATKLLAEIEGRLRAMQATGKLDYAEVKALGERLKSKRFNKRSERPQPNLYSRSKHRRPQ